MSSRRALRMASSSASSDAEFSRSSFMLLPAREIVTNRLGDVSPRQVDAGMYVGFRRVEHECNVAYAKPFPEREQGHFALAVWQIVDGDSDHFTHLHCRNLLIGPCGGRGNILWRR